MKRTYGALALLSVLALLPAVAQARGYGRGGGYVNTPFGTIPMGTMSAAGGNPFMAEEMMQMQMMYQQQQMYMRQQQQYMQQMQKMQKQGQNPNGSNSSVQQGSGSNPFGASSSGFTSSSSSKKKKRTHTTSRPSSTKKATTTTTATGDNKSESN